MVINNGDIVNWSWSPPGLVNGLTYQVVQVADAASTTSTGFSSGTPTSTGINKKKKNTLTVKTFSKLNETIQIKKVHFPTNLTHPVPIITGRGT